MKPIQTLSHVLYIYIYVKTFFIVKLIYVDIFFSFLLCLILFVSTATKWGIMAKNKELSCSKKQPPHDEERWENTCLG